jgi:hypothetical protein
MAVPNAPYFVHFSADPAASARIDHSQSAPGGAVHRAGRTSIDFRGKGGLTWQPETGARRGDGLVPFYFRSVNVYFRLTDYVVRITSDYAAGSCSFNATMRHEVDEHIVNPTRIMYGFRDQVVAALNAVRLPTENAPQWLRADQADAVEAGYIRQVGAVIQNYRNQVSAALRRAKDASDSAASYQQVYRQCPAEEWNRP